MGRELRLERPFHLGEKVEAYYFGTVGRRVSDLPFTFRSANNVATIPQIYPDGFRPNLVIREWDFEFVEGFRGELGGWSWDVSTSYGRDRASENTSNTLNASLGPLSPTVFYVGALKSTEWDNSIDITRGFKLANGGDLQLSFGAQHRRETYEVEAGEPASYAAGSYVYPAGVPFAGQRPPTGAQATPGFQPADASKSKRNSVAAYGEVGYTPVEKLFLGAAVRYENYDDASGSTLVGKFNARYELTDWLAVRGAASTGFRAPGLAQQNYAASSSQFRLVNGVLDLLLIKTLPVSSPQAIALGAQPLKPEKSKNLSGGVTPGADLRPGDHHRRLPDRRRRPDRHHLDADRDGCLEHPGRQRPPGLAERAVLHQRHRHPDQGRRRGRNLAARLRPVRQCAGQRRLQLQRHQYPLDYPEPAAAGGAGARRSCSSTG